MNLHQSLETKFNDVLKLHRIFDRRAYDSASLVRGMSVCQLTKKGGLTDAQRKMSLYGRKLRI
jgi:hypothetical protein